MGIRPGPGVAHVPTVADIERAVPNASHTCVPLEAHMGDAGPNGKDFVPGGLNHGQYFWENVVLKDNHDKELLMMEGASSSF